MLIFTNNMLRYIFINISTIYIFSHIINFKSTNKQNINILLAFVSSIFIALFYNIFINALGSITTLIILYFLLGITNSILTKNKLYYSLICTLLSMAISLSIFIFSVFISSMIRASIPYLSKDNPIILIIAMILASFISYGILNIKRFKYRIFFPKKQGKY